MRNLLFYICLIPLTIYYSYRMFFTPEDAPLDVQDLPGLRWARKLIALLGPRIDADLSALDPKGHYVFICNHQSNFDIPIIYTIFKDYHVRFVARKSLFEIPIFGRAMTRAGHVSIDRSNRRAGMKSLAEAVDRIQGGISPFVFPEGTRNPDLSRLMDFKIGGMVLALKCGLPVAPIVMSGTGRFMPKGSLFFRRSQTIRIRVLPVIDASAYDIKERERFKDDLYRIMSEAYKELEQKDAA